MTDDLSRLRAEIGRATPAADPDTRADHMTRAMESFENLHAAPQDFATGMRHNTVPPKKAGLVTGVLSMLSNLTRRPWLAVSTSAAALAVALVAVTPALRDAGRPHVAPLADAGPGSASAPAGTPPLATPRHEAAVPATGAAAPVPQTAPAPEETAKAGTKSAPAAGRLRTNPVTSDEVMRESMSLPAPVPPAAAAARATRMSAPALAEMPPVSLPDTEAWSNADPNPVKSVAEAPVSSFSADVDTASWSVLRSSLTRGALPPAGSVRVEEMVNYFPYAYPAPADDAAPFRPTVTVMQTPWNPDTRILHIGIQGRLPEIAARPPLNLVFLVDTSGSMNDPDKLPLLVQSFRLMLGQLRSGDRVAIVAYAGSAGEVLAPTPASERDKILLALKRLEAGGSTAGAEGLNLAYQVAEDMAKADSKAVSRVILATDGDFNVGVSDPDDLRRLIAAKRDRHIYLSVLGFGRGNLDDQTMQTLAQNGNGIAAYIDTLGEAQKMLVDQLSGALFPLADDVKFQVEFNPETVAEYRLIGYETRTLAREDFNNDRVDAGDIGAGHQVTAIYEITPKGSPATLSDPLRYGAQAKTTGHEGETTGHEGELAWLRLRWKAPGAETSELIAMPVPDQVSQGGTDQRFALAIAGFGQLLGGSKYLGHWGYGDALTLASEARGEDAFGYRAGAISLMRIAESLAK